MRIKDHLLLGLVTGLLAPFLFIVVLYLALFSHFTVDEFIRQAFVLKVHFKLISIGVFFADLGLFYLYLRLNKNNATKGVILSVMIYFFLMLLL